MSGPARAGRRLSVFAGTDSGDPRPRGGIKVPERGKKAAFSFGPATARFLFNKIEKKMGGWILGARPHFPAETGGMD